MAYTFLKAQGQEIGKSLLEADKVDLAKQTAGRSQGAQRANSCCRSITWSPTRSRPMRVIQQIGEGQPIPADMMALDIGPKTIEMFSRRNFATRARSSGTARWASSRSRPSPRAR